MEDTKKCPFCAELIKKDAIKCKYCWSDLDSKKVWAISWNPIKYKNKNIAGLLALILWGLWLHKFYLELYVQGLIYILFCWTFIPSIIALFEWLSYLLTKKEDWDKKYNS